MGKRATTPPSSTANRSSEMVPRMMGRVRMKVMPAPKRCTMLPCTGPRGAAWATVTRRSSSAPSTKQPQHTA